MSKRKCVIFLTAVAVILFCFIYRINIKYPNPTVKKAKNNMEYKSMEYEVKEAGFYTEKEVEALWPDEEFEDYQGYFVQIMVSNVGKERKKIDLGDYELVSESGFTQGIDMQTFLHINGEDVKDRVYINSGETETYTFPFLIVNANFSDKQWKDLNKEQFGLVLSLYPEKKELIL